VFKDFVSPFSFVRDFIIIRFDCGRRTGKTSYLIEEFLKKPDETLLIVLNNDLKYFYPQHKNVLSNSQIVNNFFDFSKIKTILIDDYSLQDSLPHKLFRFNLDLDNVKILGLG
jgi:hypothetical protein